MRELCRATRLSQNPRELSASKAKRYIVIHNYTRDISHSKNKGWIPCQCLLPEYTRYSLVYSCLWYVVHTDDVVNMFLWRFPIKCVHEITGINFLGSILSDDDDKHERSSYFMEI